MQKGVCFLHWQYGNLLLTLYESGQGRSEGGDGGVFPPPDIFSVGELAKSPRPRKTNLEIYVKKSVFFLQILLNDKICI